MHGFASLLALRTLQSHKVGRYFPLVIAVAGFLYPLTGGIITSKNCVILMSALIIIIAFSRKEFVNDSFESSTGIVILIYHI